MVRTLERVGVPIFLLVLVAFVGVRRLLEWLAAVIFLGAIVSGVAAIVSHYDLANGHALEMTGMLISGDARTISVVGAPGQRVWVELEHQASVRSFWCPEPPGLRMELDRAGAGDHNALRLDEDNSHCAWGDRIVVNSSNGAQDLPMRASFLIPREFPTRKDPLTGFLTARIDFPAPKPGQFHFIATGEDEEFTNEYFDLRFPVKLFVVSQQEVKSLEENALRPRKDIYYWWLYRFLSLLAIFVAIVVGLSIVDELRTRRQH